MGKHSNIILYNAQNKIIIGSIHNISSQKSSIREIYGGMKYFYPPQKQKLDILNISYSTFFEIAKDFDIKEISNNFYYFSQNILSQILKDKNKDELNDIFNFMQSLQGNKTGQNKKFMIDFWTKSKNITTNNIITINGAIDDYTKEVLFDEIMKEKKLKLQKYLSNDIKKLSKIVSINLEDKSINLKKSADIIMNNLYKINPNDTELVEGDYKIALDKNLNPIQNANKYYELYKKAKTAFEYNKKRTLEAKEKLSYFNDILFNIENSKDFLELKEIKNELIDLGYIEEKKETLKQPSVLKENFEGYDIYIGKNGIQNNYLISNIASDNDLWFHAKDCPSAHIILKIPKGKIEPNKEVLEYCSKLAKQNSKAKDSTKASIIMTKRKYLKKPPNTYPGFVTYKNEVEIII